MNKVEINYIYIMKPYILLLGFLLFGLGLLSIILNMTGLEFAFLSWMQAFSRLTNFIIYLLCMVIGAVIMYLAGTDWQNIGEEK